MARLPNGLQGLDEHQCTIFDSRIVWEVSVPMNLDVMQSVAGTGEVERTGERVDEVRTYHFLAPTNEAFVRAIVAERFGRTRIVGEITFKPLVKIDGEASFSHK